MIYDNIVKLFLDATINSKETKTVKVEIEIICKNFIYDENDRMYLDVMEEHSFTIPAKKSNSSLYGSVGECPWQKRK